MEPGTCAQCLPVSNGDVGDPFSACSLDMRCVLHGRMCRSKQKIARHCQNIMHYYESFACRAGRLHWTPTSALSLVAGLRRLSGERTLKLVAEECDYLKGTSDLPKRKTEKIGTWFNPGFPSLGQ